MDSKIYFSDEFLKKCKELSQNEKFEPCPPKQSEYWVTRMWTAAVIKTIYWSGHEIVEKKKDESKS